MRGVRGGAHLADVAFAVPYSATHQHLPPTITSCDSFPSNGPRGHHTQAGRCPAGEAPLPRCGCGGSTAMQSPPAGHHACAVPCFCFHCSIDVMAPGLWVWAKNRREAVERRAARTGVRGECSWRACLPASCMPACCVAGAAAAAVRGVLVGFRRQVCEA